MSGFVKNYAAMMNIFSKSVVVLRIGNTPFLVHCVHFPTTIVPVLYFYQASAFHVCRYIVQENERLQLPVQGPTEIGDQASSTYWR